MTLQSADAPPAAGPVSPDVFRSVFRDHAARVIVVTAAGPDGPVGFTASSLVSVSAAPPIVSFAMARSARSWPTVSRSSSIAVHLLHRDQQVLARTFSRRDVDRFAGVPWRPGPTGEPVLHGCAAVLSCQLLRYVPAGDHALLLSQVTAASLDRPGDPLLHHQGAFASLVPIAPSR
jgi:flavin reductase (DIM6/NTAB) family NADH-FMN oxidoreductase RutF